MRYTRVNKNSVGHRRRACSLQRAFPRATSYEISPGIKSKVAYRRVYKILGEKYGFPK